MNIKKTFISILGSLLIGLNAMAFPAFAETSLPDGAVKGLPERLAALDDEGNAVNSATGEYFFRVEDMELGETYTKNIQLMNLREDATYHIYMYTEPLFKDGEIDLEEGCECVFYLDGKEFYRGDVNGKGNIDLTETHFDCGTYAPGESHTLRAEITWVNVDVIKNVDNGHRLIDKDGEHVLVGPDGEGYADGEIEFKWIFYAMVGDDSSDTDTDTTEDSSTTERSDTDSSETDTTSNSTSDSTSTQSSDGGDSFFPPKTGVLLNSGAFWLTSMGVIGVMIVILLILIRRKNKDKGK